jgi:hypothetical protein
MLHVVFAAVFLAFERRALSGAVAAPAAPAAPAKPVVS